MRLDLAHAVRTLASAEPRSQSLTAPVERLAEFAGSTPPVETIGFTRTAARGRTYDAYAAEMASTPTHELDYLALALLGPTKVINSLTGSLPLLQ